MGKNIEIPTTSKILEIYFFGKRDTFLGVKVLVFQYLCVFGGSYVGPISVLFSHRFLHRFLVDLGVDLGVILGSFWEALGSPNRSFWGSIFG